MLLILPSPALTVGSYVTPFSAVPGTGGFSRIHLQKQLNDIEPSFVSFCFFNREELTFLASEQLERFPSYALKPILLLEQVGLLTPSDSPPTEETCREHPPASLPLTSDGNLRMEGSATLGSSPSAYSELRRRFTPVLIRILLLPVSKLPSAVILTKATPLPTMGNKYHEAPGFFWLH